MLCRLALKVAVTLLPANATVQEGFAPAQFPVQLAKVEPGAGVAVSVTWGLPAKFAAQVPGQSMPAGALLTVPVPAPATLTVSCDTPFTKP